jgi:hypothetical protein
MAGVDEPGVIDVVTLKPSGTFELIMVETRPWTDPLPERIREILAKAETYLTFAFEGEMAKLYPDSVGAPLSIRLDSAHQLRRWPGCSVPRLRPMGAGRTAQGPG